MTDIGRVALAARVFTITALTSLAALAGVEYLTGALLVLLTAACAVAVAMTRRVSETTVAIAEGMVVAALAVLTFPDQANVTPYLVIPALIGGVGQLALTGALRYAPVSTVVPMDYSSLVWATLYGWLLFGVLPTPYTWIGAPVIIASGLYIVWRERRLSLSSASVAQTPVS